MIESGASAGHGADKIVGKDGSGGQPEGIFVIRGITLSYTHFTTWDSSLQQK